MAKFFRNVMLGSILFFSVFRPTSAAEELKVMVDEFTSNGEKVFVNYVQLVPSKYTLRIRSATDVNPRGASLEQAAELLIQSKQKSSRSNVALLVNGGLFYENNDKSIRPIGAFVSDGKVINPVSRLASTVDDDQANKDTKASCNEELKKAGITQADSRFSAGLCVKKQGQQLKIGRIESLRIIISEGQCSQALQSTPALIENGKNGICSKESSYIKRRAYPRTGICTRGDGTAFIVVTSASYLRPLADWMLSKLGCTEAINLGGDVNSGMLRVDGLKRQFVGFTTGSLVNYIEVIPMTK
jgi:uncharacterized protein YigE (DUF2233 family)